MSRASITSGSSACSNVEADAGPAYVRHRPAGDAVEVRDLLSAREGAQVGECERRGPLDVAGDAQSVVGRRDVGMLVPIV
jgi:hypothetical protein